ncbi:MAG: hypothetical protein MJK04_37960, partial [Psychrosphaera sp.]|nr:hypothetical protein [Psychrosphaera sp.]
ANASQAVTPVDNTAMTNTVEHNAAQQTPYKAKALGFLYELSTSPQTRQRWQSDPTWGGFFDYTTDLNVVSALNHIGDVASGQVTDERNLAYWQLVSKDIESTFVKNFFADNPLEKAGYTAKLDDDGAQLPLVLAQLTFNGDARAAFLRDPQAYISAIGLDSEAAAKGLVEFGQLASAGDQQQAKAQFAGYMARVAPAEFIKEQHLMW